MTRNVDPDRACARDWYPVEAPEDRREAKREAEPIRWSSAVSTDASSADPDPDSDQDVELEPDVVPDVGGRYG